MPTQVDESVHMEIFVLEPFFIVELVGVYVTGNRGTVLYSNTNLGTPKVRPELILQSVENETRGRVIYIYIWKVCWKVFDTPPVPVRSPAS